MEIGNLKRYREKESRIRKFTENEIRKMESKFLIPNA
jgi:hypothetical protein